MGNDNNQELVKQVNARLNTKNEEMDTLNKAHKKQAMFIMHGTHMSPEEFARVCGSFNILPAFEKHTQNELDIIKEFKDTLSDDDIKKLNIFKRVFGIEAKKDQNGNVVSDKDNTPVPQDGSYAYSLKKCSAAICFTENGAPVLIGYEKAYSDYETERKNGYIYCLDGKNFKPEYDKDGNTFEWTSLKDENVLNVTTTTPDIAMDHNVQFVIFKSEHDLDKAFKRDKDKPFENILTSDSDIAKSLSNAISSGKATYINASSRGHNPQIDFLTKAQCVCDIKQQQFEEQFVNYAKIYEELIMPEIKNISMQANNRSTHGIGHTEMVGLRAIDYALHLNKNPLPVMIAAGLHDCARQNDNQESDHAHNAEPITREFIKNWNQKYPQYNIDEQTTEHIVFSITNHTDGKVNPNNNYISQCLWDADRTRLSWQSRFRPQYLSTQRALTVASYPIVEQEKYIAGIEKLLKTNNIKMCFDKLQRPDWQTSVCYTKNNQIFIEAISDYNFKRNQTALDNSALVQNCDNSYLKEILPQCKSFNNKIIYYEIPDGKNYPRNFETDSLSDKKKQQLAQELGTFLAHIHNMSPDGFKQVEYHDYEYTVPNYEEKNKQILSELGVTFPPKPTQNKTCVTYSNTDFNQFYFKENENKLTLCGANGVQEMGIGDASKDFLSLYMKFGREFTTNMLESYNKTAKTPMSIETIDYHVVNTAAHMYEKNKDNKFGEKLKNILLDYEKNKQLTDKSNTKMQDKSKVLNLRGIQTSSTTNTPIRKTNINQSGLLKRGDMNRN